MSCQVLITSACVLDAGHEGEHKTRSADLLECARANNESLIQQNAKLRDENVQLIDQLTQARIQQYELIRTLKDMVLHHEYACGADHLSCEHVIHATQAIGKAHT